MVKKLFWGILMGIYGCTTVTNEQKNTEMVNYPQAVIPIVKDSVITTENKNDLFLESLAFCKATIEPEDSTDIYPFRDECAISVMPDTTWLREYKNSMPEEAWDNIIFDYQYYESLATDTIKLNQIPYFHIWNIKKRFLIFYKSDSSTFVIDRSKMRESWGIILFNGHDDPVIWEDSFIGNALKEVYQK